MQATHEKIKEFLKNTIFDYDSCDEIDTMEFSTRENGDVGAEEHSHQDWLEGIRIKRELNKKYDNVEIIVITCDEWVMIEIEVL